VRHRSLEELRHVPRWSLRTLGRVELRPARAPGYPYDCARIGGRPC